MDDTTTKGPWKLGKAETRGELFQIWQRFPKRSFGTVGVVIVVGVGLVSLFAPVLAPYDPSTMDIIHSLEPPGATHWLGTDEFGRDLFSRILFGTRLSLIVGLASTFSALAIAVLLGLISGYYGGRVDMVIMRIMDVFFAFPATLLAFAVVAALGPSTSNVILVIALVTTPSLTRMARGTVLAVRRLDYVMAAKTAGFSDLRIILLHVMPNTISPVLVVGILAIGHNILIEAALSFLGLGAQALVPTLGRMLSDGRVYMEKLPHLVLFPGLFIMLIVFGFSLIGDTLRDALDPKFRGAIRPSAITQAKESG